MENIKKDANELGGQLLVPLVIVIGIVILTTTVYCVYTRISRQRTQVVDIDELVKQRMR